MNDSSTGPLVIGLLFTLRCLIPLGILFGISYLLQRLGLVDNPASEKKTGLPEDESGQTLGGKISPVKITASQPASSRKQGKKRTPTPKTRSRNQ